MATSPLKGIKQGNVAEAGAGWSENPSGSEQESISSREPSAETSILCVQGTTEPTGLLGRASEDSSGNPGQGRHWGLTGSWGVIPSKMESQWRLWTTEWRDLTEAWEKISVYENKMKRTSGAAPGEWNVQVGRVGTHWPSRVLLQ